MSSSSPSDSRLFVSARSKSEYLKMFDLSTTELSLRILDCAGGAASFTAEMRSEGLLAWAVDPLYGMSEQERIELVETGYNHAVQNIINDNTAYNWGFPTSPEEHRQLRRRSADIFLEDIASNVSYYISGKLEALPFSNSSFDILLCSHFLFTYADLLTEDEHVRCVFEMLRVTTQVVRIYPVVGFGVDAKPALKAVTDECARLGYEFSVKDVPYRFLRNASQMLEIVKSK